MKRIEVIAHRGASGYELENTLPAFQLALEQGATIIEMDVRQTKDGVPIIFHDETMKRILQIDLSVASISFEKWKNIQVKYGKTGNEYSLPSLAEVLEKLPSCSIDLELKDFSNDFSFETSVFELIREYGFSKRIYPASKRVEVHEWLSKNFNSFHRILLQKRRSTSETLSLVGRLNPQVVQIRKHGLNREFIQALNRVDCRAFLFYADDPHMFQKALDSGVDGILTNFPDRLVDFLQGLE